MVPGTLMYVYVGSLAGVAAGAQTRTTGQYLLYGVGLLATAAVTLLITRIAGRALQNRIEPDATPRHPLERTEDTRGIETLVSTTQTTHSYGRIEPWDEHNQALIARVHPPHWINPTPTASYDFVVIGAGTAGLVAAAGAAGVGAKVALVEKHLMGGDCLNVGCVPSKTLIRSAQVAADARQAGEFGVRLSAGVQTDFTAVMERMRRIRAHIAPHDSAERFRNLGVDVFLGEGRFLDSETLLVGDNRLRFQRAVIATGARPIVPPIPGLAAAAPMTNESVFNLTAPMARLAVIGGGPIGCELAQVFQRLGTQVTLFHNKGYLLDREDPETVIPLQAVLQREGVQMILDARIERVELRGPEKLVAYEAGGRAASTVVDGILVCVGRQPNIEGLNLANLGVKLDPRKGIVVDDFLRTSNPRLYACGDVCMASKFTHAADFAARIVVQNALFALGPFGRRRVSSLLMPRCTYTDPAIAHVGLTQREARDRGIAVDTYRQSFEGVDRAVTDGDTDGLVSIHTRKGSGDILGATIVSRDAGELISEITTAMANRIGLGQLANVIHPYPTRAEAIRKCGDAYNRTRLTPTVQRILKLRLALGR